MSPSRTRKIVVAGVLSAIAILLGATRWGFIPWFTGISLTILNVPVVIGAVLEGPIVGTFIGLIYGLFSLYHAAVDPGPGEAIFTDPRLSIFPRLFIGLVAWLVWRALRRWPVAGLLGAGIAGSLTNTVLVLGMIGILGILNWIPILTIALTNGLPEAALTAIIVLPVVAAWRQIEIGRKGSDL